MPEDIPTQVARNRRNVKRIDGQFVSVPSNVQQNLRFLRNSIEVEVSLDVYTRPLNDALVSGHPAGGTHGSGHGVSGDRRGAWSQVVSGGSTHEWTRDGRNAIRDALDGQATGSIQGTSVGTGSGAGPGDSALVAETGSTFAYGVKDAGNEVRARSHYLYSETGEGGLDPQEFGLEASSGQLMARATTSSAVAVTSEQEVRVDLTATISGSGGGNSTVTDSGEQTVADSIQTEGSLAGLAEIAWGTGTPDLTEATGGLGNQVFKKDALRELDLERIEVAAPQFEFEPAGQPYDYTEAAVLDQDGNVVWVVGFDAYPKDDGTKFTTSVGFRIV
ncbi:hypothetical protein M201_gp47 [Haloarcula californiae tailed virus 2]|uniref:Uncharacterized protein n=1 Tax=Haloarcula californiae tailed virus 2 TaxID=1273747 RepID=R4TM68_9CAUD|nr:hypothetical protein M201_gp47 [Haloarcula californiae tailed virus 2]AGM11817.1 hypothetical protein HCTV2_46 [Haloarcula californiae tailed virus 2]